MKYYHFSDEEFACLEGLRVPLAVFQFLDRRVVTRVLSAGFCVLFDFESREEAYEVMTTDMYSTAHPDDAARIANAAYRFATEDVRFEVVYRIRTNKSSSYKLIHAVGEHVFKPTGERLAYVWYTDEGSYTGENDPQKEALKASFRSALHVESLIQASYFDDLTSLPNMSFFLELLDNGREALRRDGETPAILFVDLNGMKYFNRKYGFAEGDNLLRKISRILVSHFKSDNCSRFGQDHFAVLTKADGLGQKLDLLLDECADINDRHSLPVRIGVYLDKDESVGASIACDRAKFACDSIENGYASSFKYYDDRMMAQMENRQYVIDNLDRALAENWIQVWYQPIIRTANGKVCDEEALSRWFDPVRGMMSPADFIPALEDSKLIYKLDLYVVDRILEKMKDQAAAGLYVVPESVNLSRSDFDTCDIVEEIRSRVDAAGIEREKLTIEITESVVGSDFEFMKTQIERFQSLGFKVWMDDFGSGYSSLDVLQSIHFDLIKFDMSFMRRFDESEATRIILTELIRMCIGLGIETVCEGVETPAQVEFLREIGCTKLQGFYYCKAIPLSEIVERNRKGIQIGFENPEETDYYAAIGRINLYDAAVVAQEDHATMWNYFNTIPMAIIESTEDAFTITRCNNTYRAFMNRIFGEVLIGKKLSYDIPDDVADTSGGFLRAIRQCGLDGRRMILDETLPDGSTIHAFVKRVAVNPVTHTAALAVAVLAVIDKSTNDTNLNYAQVASALTSDYFDLFYVDLDTEEFSQYSSNRMYHELSAERRGKHFFEECWKDADASIYEGDRAYFRHMFTRENVLHALDIQGSFSLTYRLMMDGEPTYVNMKVVRMKSDPRHLVIGVNSVNVQMRQKQALEQLEQERITYARIAALSGNFICIYSIDPDTERYVEYSSTGEYAHLNVPKFGEHFFDSAQVYGAKAICPEDMDLFRNTFTRENVMQEIRRNGVFEVQLRFNRLGEVRYMSLKAAMVNEKVGPQIVFGIKDIDTRVRREMEYSRNLASARARANIDPVTGIRNREAFLEAQAQLDARLALDRRMEFAIAMFDVRGIDDIRETWGSDAGNSYLKQACGIICAMFKRSPVFRVGDSGFLAIVQGRDYEALDTQLELLSRNNEINTVNGGMIIAFGAVRYSGKGLCTDVCAQATERMKRYRVPGTEN